jgi:hypothetical protein
MRRKSVRKDREDTLRRMLAAWKNDYLIEQDAFGSFPEKVREALNNEIIANPGKWNVAARGREAIIGLFMAGVWRSNEVGATGDATDDDKEEEEQLSFAFFVERERLPLDITYRDPTAGKHKMRTVSTQAATVGQWMRAIELQEDKHAEAARRISRNKNIGAVLLARAGGDPTARIIDLIDIADAA